MFKVLKIHENVVFESEEQFKEICNDLDPENTKFI